MTRIRALIGDRESSTTKNRKEMKWFRIAHAEKTDKDWFIYLLYFSHLLPPK